MSISAQWIPRSDSTGKTDGADAYAGPGLPRLPQGTLQAHDFFWDVYMPVPTVAVTAAPSLFTFMHFAFLSGLLFDFEKVMIKTQIDCADTQKLRCGQWLPFLEQYAWPRGLKSFALCPFFHAFLC